VAAFFNLNDATKIIPQTPNKPNYQTTIKKEDHFDMNDAT
jgi:hypothetical protein